MNIIELFENSNIKKDSNSAFTFEDTIQIKKQFDVEKSQNPSLENNLSENLLSAISDYRKEFNFIVNNRILYNFFSKKNYSRTHFNPLENQCENEKVKIFINKFLANDLDSFFASKVDENLFEQIDDLLQQKEYFPQDSLDKLNNKLSEKISTTLVKLKEGTISDSYSLNFIKYRSFYDSLNHFRSNENDDLLKELLVRAKLTIGMTFLDSMMLAMHNYRPIDYDFDNSLKTNKEEAFSRTQKTSYSAGSGLSIGSGIVLVIIIIRLILLMARCSR